MRTLTTIACFLSACLFTACIELYDRAFPEQDNFLVVEAAITTEEGPYQVRLTTTRNIRNEENQFKFRVQNAMVSITNSSGRIESLTELDTSGIYLTGPAFRGQVGETYVLNITLEDSRVYESDQIVLEALPIPDSLGITYGSKKVLSDAGISIVQTGFFVSAHLNDPLEARNFYLSKWDYTYKISTQGQPSVCWVEEMLTDFSVFEDQLTNGGPSELDLFFLPVEGRMFYDRILLRARLYSLDESSYLFWKTAYDSRYSQGGLFDPTPNTIAANVRNLNDPEELVLGYFYASDVFYLERYIRAREFPERIDYNIGFAGPCTMLPKTTDKKPDYWRE